MSQFYFNSSHSSSNNTYPSYSSAMPSHNHHGGRSRRTGRFNNSQNSHRHRHNNRHPKEAAEAAFTATYRLAFEAARSFDLEDDELFCPWHLLTDDDLHSMHSSSSDRSSLSSGSPDSSPLQQQLQPNPNFNLPPTSMQMQQPTSFQQSAAPPLKMHQPLPQRAHKAIPIVNPNTRTAASPQPSESPARQMQKPYATSNSYGLMT